MLVIHQDIPVHISTIIPWFTAQVITTTLGTMGITTIVVTPTVSTSAITLGMVGVLDLVSVHRIRGGVITIGDRDGIIGVHITTDHHTITGEDITDQTGHHIIGEMV